MNKPIILVVDANGQQIHALRQLLHMVNCELLQAASAERALQLCRLENMFLVLLDLDVPQIDSFHLAEQLQEDPATNHLPLIFLSSSSLNISDRLHAYEVGAVDYLKKPLDERILQSKVKVFLQMQRQGVLLRQALQRSEDLRSAAREREAYLRQVLEDAPIPVMLHAEDGDILLLSKTWLALSGYQAHDLPNLDAWLELAFSPAQQEQMRLVFAQALQAESRNEGAEYQVRGVHGNTLIWELRSRQLAALPDGRRQILTMAVDISHRKQAEQALRDESRKNAMLLNATSDGIHMLDLQGRLLQFNQSFCNLLGYSAEELYACTVTKWKVQWSLSELQEKILHLPEHGAIWETLYLRKDGRLLDVEVNAIRVQFDGKTMLYGSARDISRRKELEETHRANEYLLETALRIAHLGTFEWNIVDNSEIWSVHFFKIFGLDPMLHRPSHDLFLSCVHPDDVRHVEQALEQALQNIRPYDVEYRIIWPEQQIRRIHAQGEMYFNDIGQAFMLIGTVQDITEQYRREEAQRLAITVFNAVDEGVVVTDPQHRIIAVNPAFTFITGYTQAEVIGRTPLLLVADENQEMLYQQCLSSLEQHHQWSGELGQKRKNGETYVESLSIKAVRDERGTITHYVRVFADITEKKKSEQLIWHQANFDALTKLANRHMLQDRLQQELRKAERDQLSMALLVIDLDRFKEINDTLGHDMGDVLLVEAARRISACVRASDTVARQGGDEFVILLAGLEDFDCVERIARSLVCSLVEPFNLGSEQAYISASIGIALYPNDAGSIDDLLKHADQAMYSSKNAGRNRHSYFAQAMQEAAQTRRRLTNDLRLALEAKQMRVYYQPIIELSTNSIHKAEALIRWEHPQRGLVSPADFIPLAEETGLINDIGDWVFREAAREVAKLRNQYDLQFQISVNKSPVQFRQDGGPTRAWFRYLQELGLSGQNIVVEITEGLLMNVEDNVTEKLLAFRDIGMQVSLDDFGTGYSSLSYLKKFDIDYLKIDKVFVSNLENDPNNLTLCESIIVMAHKLGLKVIAEGVESPAQRELLRKAGCDYAQGFLFASPLPALQFEEFLCTWQNDHQFEASMEKGRTNPLRLEFGTGSVSQKAKFSE